MNDKVNRPAHYTMGKIEAIDGIAAACAGLEGIEAVCTANSIKYLWRWKHKNGVEDLRKAAWYIDRLISIVQTQQDIAGNAPEKGQSGAACTCENGCECDRDSIYFGVGGAHG